MARTTMRVEANADQYAQGQRPHSSPAAVRALEEVVGLPIATSSLVAAVATVAAFATRLPFRSRHLFTWDAAQFALALDDFDIARHQPHPPGYVLFVVAGWALRTLVQDANLAFILWNIVLTAASGLVVFALAHLIATDNRSSRAWGSLLLFLSSPLVWFYGLVAEIYISEMFAVLLVAFTALRTLQGAPHMGPALAIALALGGFLKPSAVVFMLPLVGLALALGPVRKKWRWALLCLASSVLWLPPLLWIQGPSQYFAELWRTFQAAGEVTSPLVTGEWRTLVVNARDTAYAVALGVGPLPLVMLPIALRRGALSLPQSSRYVVLLCLGPYLLVLLFVHMAKLGYALPIVPLASVIVGAMLTRRFGRNPALALVLTASVGNAAFFVFAEPVPPEAIGYGLTFDAKTWRQRALAQANLLLSATAPALREADDRMARVVGSVRRTCGGSPVVITEDPVANWRKLQYELPEARVVRLPDRESPFMIAQRRGFVNHTQQTLQLREECATFWVLPSVSTASQLAEQGAIQSVTEGLFVTRGERHLLLADRYSLSIAP